MMKVRAILLAGLVLLLTSCANMSIASVGQTANKLEEGLCPLTTVRNLEGAILNVVRLIPFFAQWQPVCPPAAPPEVADG